MEMTVVWETGRRMNKDEKKVGATEAGERGRVAAVISVRPRLLLTRFPLPPGQAVSRGPEHPILLPPGCGPGPAASGQRPALPSGSWPGNGARLCRTPAAGIPVAGGPALPGDLLFQLQRVILLVTILILITGRRPRPQTQHHAAPLHSPVGRQGLSLSCRGEQSEHRRGGGGVDASGVSCRGVQPPDGRFFSPLSSSSYYYPSYQGRRSSLFTPGLRLPPAHPRDVRASLPSCSFPAARHLQQCWWGTQ